jgi:hypothetical protein
MLYHLHAALSINVAFLYAISRTHFIYSAVIRHNVLLSLCQKNMEKFLEKIERWIADEPTESETQKSSLDIAVERVLYRLLRCVAPVLLIALVINLIIMFTLPVEMAMSRWFWLKDPISIGAAYFIHKLLKPSCHHVAQ